MVCLLAVLFFSLTGITLNHPEWVLGGKEMRHTYKGTLSSGYQKDGKVDWLQVVEQIRRDQPVHGSATDMRVDGDEGSLSFKAPGNQTDCFFDLKSGKYELNVTTQGLIGVLNDLHRGRDSGSKWGWLIDVSGAILTLVSLTGLGILLYLKKSRTIGLILALAGCGIVGWLAAAAAR